MFIHLIGALPCYWVRGGSKGSPPTFSSLGSKLWALGRVPAHQPGTWQWGGKAEADWPGPTTALPPTAAQSSPGPHQHVLR